MKGFSWPPLNPPCPLSGFHHPHGSARNVLLKVTTFSIAKTSELCFLFILSDFQLQWKLGHMAAASDHFLCQFLRFVMIPVFLPLFICFHHWSSHLSHQQLATPKNWFLSLLFPSSPSHWPPHRDLGQSSLRLQLLTNLISHSPACSVVPSVKEPLGLPLGFLSHVPPSQPRHHPAQNWILYSPPNLTFIWDTINISVPGLEHCWYIQVAFFIPLIEPVIKPSRLLH